MKALKVLKISAVFTALLFSSNSEVKAQSLCKSMLGKYHHTPDVRPSKCVRPAFKSSVRMSYDESSTLLTVDFPQNSEKSTVEVYRDGVKVTGITAGGGTTFSCTLKDYGEGEYDIIVSKGNTVVYSKNVSVR